MRSSRQQAWLYVLVLMAFCQKTLQIPIDIDLNKEPSPELAEGPQLHSFSTSHRTRIDLNKPPLTTIFIADHSNYNTDARAISPSSRTKISLGKESQKVPVKRPLEQVQKEARVFAREVAIETGHPKDSPKYWNAYRSAYQRHKRAKGYPSRNRAEMSPEILEHLRTDDRLRAEFKRKGIQQRRKEGGSSPDPPSPTMSLPQTNANAHGQSSIKSFFQPKQPAYAPPPAASPPAGHPAPAAARRGPARHAARSCG